MYVISKHTFSNIMKVTSSHKAHGIVYLDGVSILVVDKIQMWGWIWKAPAEKAGNAFEESWIAERIKPTPNALKDLLDFTFLGSTLQVANIQM